MLAAHRRKFITARARNNKRTARMLANASKDHSIPLLIKQVLFIDKTGFFLINQVNSLRKQVSFQKKQVWSLIKQVSSLLKKDLPVKNQGFPNNIGLFS